MPRIVYLSWPAAEISGGIKTIFQHVEMLAAAGVDAAVATADGVAPKWFDSTARLVTQAQVTGDDVLVFPENDHQLIARFAAHEGRKLVFCQNPTFIYRGLGPWLSSAEAGVTHVMCPSHSVMHVCRRRFPDLGIVHVPLFIDHARFVPAPVKRLQIAAIPRKRPQEFGVIRDLFRARYPQFDAVDWLVIQGATEQVVAQELGRSEVFLSLARLEAHGLTTLEAFACGAVVAGFCGIFGGSDSATARNGFWAEEDDVIGCVEQLARAVALAAERGPAYDAMIEDGKRTAAHYSRENTQRELLRFWHGFLAQPQRAAKGAR